MLRIVFIVWMGIVLGLPVMAQNDSTSVKKKKERKIELVGEVYDSFTKAKIKAHVTLMRSDSTVVDTITCSVWSTSSYYHFNVPATHEDYILKATAEGYEDTYLNYALRHIARNSYFEIPRILMKKKMDDIWRENDLEGVTVTGTRVKIAYKGDTIIYNAAAFNLPEGSMLDGLIRQMPGAELKDNGDIYINGKKVDYLTLNGKDFFKGQNKIMLENLPYFTVRDIKVYNKTTKKSELIGHDVEKKDYVMDVQLKREYNRGYFGNVEGGIGTDKRYMSRLFATYYGDHSRISLFGNLNNVNETRRPGSDGEWRPSDMPQGLTTTKSTGMHLSTEDQDKNWNEEADVSLNWNDADNLSRTDSERFASEGNILGASQSWSRQRNFQFNANNEFVINKPFMLYSRVSLGYSQGDRYSLSEDSTWRQTIINKTVNNGMNKFRTLSLDGNLLWYKKFSWGDYTNIHIAGSYGRQKPNESFSLNNTFFAQTDSKDYRRFYTDNRGSNYQYQANAGYTLQMLNNWSVSPSIGFTQSWNDQHNEMYRLDRLKEMAADKQEINWLPSAREELLDVRDEDNSDRQTLLTRSYQGEISIMRSNDNQYLSLSLPIRFVNEKLWYQDGRLDTIARRHYTNFSPSMGFYRWGGKNGLQSISYNMSVSRPNLSSLMPHDNTTNPLVTRIHNTDLKPSVAHFISCSFQFNNDSTRRFVQLWTNGQLTTNSMGTRTLYNRETGAYTYKSDNINGNWSWSLGTSYQRPVDRKKRLTLKQRVDVGYTHSVDFPIQYVSAATLVDGMAEKSVVNNWNLHERLEMEYQKDKLTVSILGDVNWRSSTSDRENFERISAFDYNYGARLMYVIPWVKLSVATDIKMFSRRGYSSKMMNTDDLVWNAELSRSIWKEKLTLKVTAFDLLHQLSNKQYSVNAQGRTESWVNCIPRYVMFSFAYKFNKGPKK